VTDLVDAIYRAATVPEAKNETFNVGADRFGTLNEDMLALFEHVGSGSKLWHLPARPGEVALRGLELLHLSPLAAWHYATMWRDSYVEVDRAKEVLGWQPKYSNAEALIRAWDWYAANQDTYGVGVTHRVAWQKGLLNAMKRVA
jgi:nucleoside-diphosphate-sugar epimerase